MGAIRFGAYATHLNIDYRYIMKLPENWSFEEGASFIVQSLTAYYSLVELGNIKANDTVLIHSAAGGVGIYANRIAKKFNAYTIGTIGSESKRNFLLNEGYDEVIVRKDNFIKQLKVALGERKLNLVLESIVNFIGSKVEVSASGGRFRCEIVSVKKPFEVRVRYYAGVQKGEGLWTIIPAGDSGAVLTYSINLEPNGFIPRLLSNFLNFSKIHSNAMKEMFKGLDKYLS